MTGTRTMTVQQAIDEIGHGRFQRRLLAVCGVTWAADAAEVLLVGFALPSIRAEFGLDAVTGGLLATATFVTSPAATAVAASRCSRASGRWARSSRPGWRGCSCPRSGGAR